MRLNLKHNHVFLTKTTGLMLNEHLGESRAKDIGTLRGIFLMNNELLQFI